MLKYWEESGFKQSEIGTGFIRGSKDNNYNFFCDIIEKNFMIFGYINSTNFHYFYILQDNFVPDTLKNLKSGIISFE